MDANIPLPRRVTRADIGKKPPALSYTARPDVVVRFLEALKAWNPDYTVEVESVGGPDNRIPTEPLWRLRAWGTER